MSTRRAAPSWAESDARELRGRVGEDGQPHTLGLQSPKRRAHLGRGPEVDGRPVLGVALEQRPPVAGAARVELGRRRGAILRQPFDVEHARGVVEPVAPELPRIAEHVELDRDDHRATRRQRRIADRDADAVDQDVERRADPALDEVLVQLVGRRVRDAEPEGRQLVARSPQQQRAENRVLAGMRDLPQDEIPRAEPGAEVGHRREGEDHGGPEDDRRPQAQSGGRRHTSMIGSRSHTRSTVREPGASPGRSRRCEGRRPTRKRHWPTGREGREGGAPSQKTCRAPNPEPLAEGGFVLRRLSILSVLLAVILTPTALAANVSIRVEGKTTTIFGAAQPRIAADNALQALDVASTAGEFYYGTTTADFGTYVSQIGKYPAAGSAGWVFKVNGVSPPVGADKVTLKDGDVVLWYYATFGAPGVRRRSSCSGCRRTATSCRPSTTPARRRAPPRRRSRRTGSGSRRRPAAPASASTWGSSGPSRPAPSARTR